MMLVAHVLSLSSPAAGRPCLARGWANQHHPVEEGAVSGKLPPESTSTRGPVEPLFMGAARLSRATSGRALHICLSGPRIGRRGPSTVTHYDPAHLTVKLLMSISLRRTGLRDPDDVPATPA